MNNSKVAFAIMIVLIIILLVVVKVSAVKPVEIDGKVYVQEMVKAEDETKAEIISQPTCFKTDKSNPVELTDEEYDLLCRVLCLEDGGESEWSQRCVCSCIYNRLISGLWGNTIADVLYAEAQFEVMPNVWSAEPSELTCEIVADVFGGNVCLVPRLMFFRKGEYHSWAKPEFNVGVVYFSSSWWYQ